jgi:hypothetical protein
VTPSPFTDLTPDQVDALPAGPERAVLRAALASEQTAEDQIGWDKVIPMLFQFLQPPLTEGQAFGYPNLLAGAGTIADNLTVIADMLRQLSHHGAGTAHIAGIVHDDYRYLGTGLIHEAWIVDPATGTRTVEGRLLFGVFAAGGAFCLQRCRGEQPTITTRPVELVGADVGLQDALAALNDVFNQAYGNPPTHRPHATSLS